MGIQGLVDQLVAEYNKPSSDQDIRRIRALERVLNEHINIPDLFEEKEILRAKELGIIC
jgi:hypothetical protein